MFRCFFPKDSLLITSMTTKVIVNTNYWT